VRVTSGTTPDGARTWFLCNWSGDRATAVAPRTVINRITAERVAAGSELSLEPWACLVLADETAS
jgi:beta-galactosidase